MTGRLRTALLVLVAFGSAGLFAELLLLEHWDSWWQWVPLALLVLAFLLAVAALVRPARAVLRAFGVVMALCVLAGALGVVLHFRGNMEFELEREGALAGWALFVESVRGATPALAPGALAQLGLLGLVTLWRHPVLGARAAAVPSTPTSSSSSTAFHSPQETA